MNTTTADTGYTTTTEPTDQPTYDRPAARRLRRSTDDAMLAGVASGLARYLGADVTLVRIATAALAIFTGAGLALYIAAWLLIPADGEDQSIAESWIASRRNRSV